MSKDYQAVKGQCPDCGCPVARHNSVLKPVGGMSLDLPVAHCGGCGTCWKTKGTEFVEAVRAALLSEHQAVKGNDQGDEENPSLPSRASSESQPTELSGNESEYEAAEDRVHKFAQGMVRGRIDQFKALAPVITQLCHDLNEAHNELLRAQGVAESDLGKYDWPEWSPQANSIRWAEGTLKVRLAKTDHWTLYPSSAENNSRAEDCKAE